MKSLLLDCFLLFLTVVPGNSAQNVTATTKSNFIRDLRQHLLTEYDPLARPVRNSSKATMVSIDFIPFHLTEVTEYEGTVAIEAWVEMSWKDEHLHWDPKHFGGVTVVHFSQEEIWKPDISILRRSSGSSNHFNERIMLEVSSKGLVTWAPSTTINLICELEYHHFPQDTQECSLYMLPWSHFSDNIDLKLTQENSTTEYLVQSNPIWTLTSITGRRFEVHATEGITVVAKFRLTLQRKASIDTQVTIVPYAAAKVLLLAMFWVPVHSRNKFVLGSVALTIQVAVLFFTEYMLPSPSAGKAALPHLQTAVFTGLVGLLFQVFITNISRIKSCSAPSLVNAFTSGKPGNILCLCTVDFQTHPNQQRDEALPKFQSPREREWYLVATFIDRVFFVILVITFIVEYCIM